MEKKLTRSRSNKVISGVLGGLAAYFNTSATLLRILFVLFVIATGFFPGVFVYIIVALFVPKETLIAASTPVGDPVPARAADDSSAV